MSEHPNAALYRMVRRRVTATVLSAVLLASCNGGGESPDSSPTTAMPPTVDSTSTTAGATTTVPPATTSSSTPPTSPPTTSADGPSGSGCTPGDAASLPEGEWFGFVEATSATGIEFDLACWFTGQAAVDASAEDGEESPPPNDYYVRNESTLTRSLPVSPQVPVVWYPDGDPTTETVVDFEVWAEAVVGRGFMFGVWLDVIDGEVHEIREQWVP